METLNIKAWLDKPVPQPRRRKAEPIEYVSTPVACRGENLHPVLWRGRQWAVTTLGIECLDGTYFISEHRIVEDIERFSFPEHMGEKSWVDIDDFLTAWLVAIALHGADVTAKKVRGAIAKSAAPHAVRPRLKPKIYPRPDRVERSRRAHLVATYLARSAKRFSDGLVHATIREIAEATELPFGLIQSTLAALRGSGCIKPSAERSVYRIMEIPPILDLVPPKNSERPLGSDASPIQELAK